MDFNIWLWARKKLPGISTNESKPRTNFNLNPLIPNALNRSPKHSRHDNSLMLVVTSSTCPEFRWNCYRWNWASLFVSPCPPECNFQSETKIEPDLRLQLSLRSKKRNNCSADNHKEISWLNGSAKGGLCSLPMMYCARIYYRIGSRRHHFKDGCIE